MCFDLSNYCAGCGWGWVGEVVAGEWFKVMVVVGGSFVASGCPLCDGGDLRRGNLINVYSYCRSILSL